MKSLRLPPEMRRELTAMVKRIGIGSVIGALIAVYIGFYLLQTVMRNYQLQREISLLQQQINNLEVEQQELKYRIQYYQTENYKEKEAREKLGLQAPGESVVILPNNTKATEQLEGSTVAKKPKRSNLQQWWDFLSGRP